MMRLNSIKYINQFKSDPAGWCGAAVMFLFTIIALVRFLESNLIFFLLLAFRDMAATWFFLTRYENKKEVGNWRVELIAYTSCAMPFLYNDSLMQIPPEFHFIASILSILGFTLATWALFDLGRSFGIVSGTRKKVTEGLYSIMRHPMYLGYVIAEFGFVLLNVSNIKVFIISVLLYVLRAKTETKHLDNNT